jgi:hypothetical protein
LKPSALNIEDYETWDIIEKAVFNDDPESSREAVQATRQQKGRSQLCLGVPLHQLDGMAEMLPNLTQS